MIDLLPHVFLELGIRIFFLVLLFFFLEGILLSKFNPLTILFNDLKCELGCSQCCLLLSRLLGFFRWLDGCEFSSLADRLVLLSRWSERVELDKFGLATLAFRSHTLWHEQRLDIGYIFTDGIHLNRDMIQLLLECSDAAIRT